jgi:adenylylsulfate kinase
MNEKYIVPQDYHITKANRQKLYKHKSFVVWFTGLSGSGKSTLANLVEQRLHDMGCHTYILDGDNVRHGLNKDLGFDEVSRQENIRRIGEVAKLMVDAGVIVLTAFISPFRSDRQMVRELLEPGEYVEVFVNCPLEICEQRDVKGLYQKARAGVIKNFTGIDSPFESPESPEVEVQTNLMSLEESVEKIIQSIKDKISV